MTGPRPDWAAVGRIIGERRRALGLPKNEAARRAAVSNTTWRLIEAGANRNPNDETLVRIARVIEVDPDLLLRAAGRRSPRQADPTIAASIRQAPLIPPAHRSLPPPPPNSPQTLNPYFTGRQEEMQRIAGYLERWEEVVRPLVITGLAGIGKTELAARYLNDHRGAYDALAWVNGSSTRTAASDLGKLARELGFERTGIEDPDGDRLDALAPVVIRRLQEDGRRWLVVIDDVSREAITREFLKELLTEGSRVRILMTSRQGAGWTLATRLPLGPLALGDAAEFLRQRSGSFLQGPPGGRDTATEDPAVAVAAELGCLPRALERVGAYVDGTGISLRSALSLAREMTGSDRLLDLLESPEAAWLPEPRQPGRPDWDLLRILAFLGRAPIDPAYLTRPSADLPESLRGLRKEQLLGSKIQKLQDRSLVTVDGDGLRVHPITQAAVRRTLEGEQGPWASTALRLLLSVFPRPDGDPADQAACRHLLPHAQAAVGYAAVHDGDVTATAQLLGRMAEHLRLEGDLDAARQHAEQAIDLFGKAMIPTAELALVRLTRALIHLDFGEFEAARAQLEQAGDEAERSGVEQHTIALLQAHLAVVEAQLGRYGEAARLVSLVVNEKERALTPQAVAVKSTVALALTFLDESKEAREFFADALASRRRLAGTRHHGFAFDCYWLATVELHEEQPHRAAYWFQLSLDIFRDLYGAEARHPRIGDCLRGLAAVDRLAGDPQGALGWLEQAGAAYPDAYGFDHPVRKAMATTRDLLRAMLERAPQRAQDWTPDQAGMAPPPADAVQRYRQQKLAIGNYLRGFEPDAEAVTALRLGGRLLDLKAFDDSLESFNTCVRLADDTLLRLTALLRLGQALARRHEPDAARREYEEIDEIVAAIERNPDAATSALPAGLDRIRKRAEHELKQLEAQPTSA